MQAELLSADWPEYRLLDSGNGRKLESFGGHILIRSEPKAWWKPQLEPSAWARAEATYLDEGREGRWQLHGKSVMRNWNMRFGEICAEIRLTDMSKHVGVFPEQSPHWQWLSSKLKQAESPRFLNLFGYTGMASLVAAKAGAKVTHVDASKPALAWARANQERSGMEAAPVRWLLDDAFKFVAREIRRGSRYDAIALDPPSFGRGPKGEIWKVEQQISELLHNIRQLLSEKPLFVLLTLYNLEASSLMLRNLVSEAFPGGNVTFGELTLSPGKERMILPLSLFARWEG